VSNWKLHIDIELLLISWSRLQRGDILGHEWMGIVDEVGSAITNVKKGDRVVASFQIS
jgi:threonine dehydrogenase-like Zn-dependent dehydrogenase